MIDERRLALRWLWIGPLIGLAALALLGYRPTKERAGTLGIAGMAAGQVLVLAIVYFTLAGVVRRVSQASPAHRLAVALRAGVTRFLLTLILATGIAWQSGLPRVPFLIWVAISYVVLINVETILLVRWMATLGNGS